MLNELRIRGLGVIEDATLPLRPGLNVLTGETGAGKTMVVSGLGLLLGERADASRVRPGASSAIVEGIVTLPHDHPALRLALDAGADIDDAPSDGARADAGGARELVLVRTVHGEGRSRAHVGGRSAPVGVLGEIGRTLVAVHGQADQWRLRRPDEHRALLDDFGGPPVLEALAEVARLHGALRGARTELDTLVAERRARTREADGLRAGLERLEQVDPQPGEDVALARESARLAHADTIRRGVGAAVAILLGDETTPGETVDVAAQVARARTTVREAASLDPVLEPLLGRLEEVAVLTSELGADLAAYEAGIDADPGRLEAVEQRRADLQGLTRRYGDSIDEVLAWGADAAERLTRLEGDDERVAELERRTRGLSDELVTAAGELTRLRTSAAQDLGRRVTDELAHLAMGRADVQVSVTPRARIGRDGADDVEIRVAANPGAPPRSVTSAASGGELSRIMLAIEVVTSAHSAGGGAQGTHGPVTLVFDEVDAGVGGGAALDVGARLAALARHHQVLVVTHLAQVAAFADHHLVVAKSSDGASTTSTVRPVSGDERRAELSRMMGGDPRSEAGLAHADDLARQASDLVARWSDNGLDPAQTKPRRSPRRGGRARAR